MKKRLYSIGLSLIILALMFSAIGCAEGPVGPQGPQGLEGVQGVAGATGPQGLRGVKGDTGEPGTPIIWMGTATSAPKSWRVLNYAYYNSRYGKSYIWDGKHWEILAKDGYDGATGATGPRGYTGATGAKGDTGPQGEQGTPGQDCAPAILQNLQSQIDALKARLDVLEFVPPTIDGVLDVGEWGSPTFTYESDSAYIGPVNIYILSNSDNLYIAAEAAGGDMSGAQGMGLATALNIYIDSDNSAGMPDNKDVFIIASDDGLGIPYVPPEQGWDCGTYYTYTASGAGITIAADGDAYNGAGIVEVKIPLSLLDVGSGSTIGLLFQAFGYDCCPVVPDVHPDWPETYADFTFGR